MKEFPKAHGFIDGACKDQQSITADWVLPQTLIDGVALKEMRAVQTDGKVLTEIYRADWNLDQADVGQLFQVRMIPGAISAWHAHQSTTDRLFVSIGQLKIVLYDAREVSRTYGQINIFQLSERRPGTVTVPPGVWHGLENVGGEPAVLINIVDNAYDYSDPDHWRLPSNTPKIPYTFKSMIDPQTKYPKDVSEIIDRALAEDSTVDCEND